MRTRRDEWGEIVLTCQARGWPLAAFMRSLMAAHGALWDGEARRVSGNTDCGMIELLERKGVLIRVMDVCKPVQGGYDVTEWWGLEHGRLVRVCGRWEVKALNTLHGRVARRWTAFVLRERWYSVALGWVLGLGGSTRQLDRWRSKRSYILNSQMR